MYLWQIVLKNTTTLQDLETTGYIIGDRCVRITHELYTYDSWR